MTSARLFFARIFSVGTLGLALACGIAGAAQAAASLLTSGGKLTGALGVEVDGKLYNVEFRDGLCADLFNGCDASSDFTFQTEDAATKASQALLDQVFLDLDPGDPTTHFDSVPSLTRGCNFDEFFDLCFVQTPYEVVIDSLSQHVVSGMAANNKNPENPDELGTFGFVREKFPDGDTSDGGFIPKTFAVWTAVPEPGTLALFGAGLAALAAARRRRAA